MVDPTQDPTQFQCFKLNSQDPKFDIQLMTESPAVKTILLAANKLSVQILH